MRKTTLLSLVAAAALAACSQPSVAKCSQTADCPADAVCVSGLCQRGVPSGGAAATVGGAGRMTSGTLTMDAVIGQPVAPAAKAGTRVMGPAEQTR